MSPSSEHAAVHGEELRRSVEAADRALDGLVKDIEKAVSPSSEHAAVHGEELRLSLEAADFALDDVVAEMEEEMDEGGSFLDGTLPLSLGSSDDGEWGES